MMTTTISRAIICLIHLSFIYTFKVSKWQDAARKFSFLHSTTIASNLELVPFEDIIPFLSEHIQQSDQILYIGMNQELL